MVSGCCRPWYWGVGRGGHGSRGAVSRGRENGRVGAGAEHLAKRSMLFPGDCKLPGSLDGDPVYSVLAPVGRVLRFPPVGALAPLERLALAVTAIRCSGSSR